MLLVISGLIWDQLRFNWDKFRRPRQWIRIPLLIQRDKKESSYEIDIKILVDEENICSTSRRIDNFKWSMVVCNKMLAGV